MNIIALFYILASTALPHVHDTEAERLDRKHSLESKANHAAMRKRFEWAQTYLINGGQAGVLELIADLETAEKKLEIARECLEWVRDFGEGARSYEKADKALREIGE